MRSFRKAERCSSDSRALSSIGEPGISQRRYATAHPVSNPSMLLALPFLFMAQAGPTEAEVGKAIQSGADFLKKKYEKGFDAVAWNSTLELVMLTLSHAGVPPSDPVFQKGLKELETCKLQYTYRVAALAMTLQRIDSRKYQDRIAHCAQWLIDTQLPEGEWGYPDTLSSADQAPKAIEVEPPKVAKSATAGSGGTVSMIKIKRTPNKNLDMKAKGDISNTQFAILGLKACLDAGIEIPQSTWKLAGGYILKTQNQDGGWGYYFNGMKDEQSYSSMTCAGVCSLVICKYGLGNKEGAKDAPVKAGLRWLGDHFKPDDNANVTKSHVADASRWLYYYLYSIERVGKIVGVDDIGKQKWYPVGAKYLLEKQKKDGSWWTGIDGVQWKQAGDIETADTCFAILFLTRATPPLVATGGGEKK